MMMPRFVSGPRARVRDLPRLCFKIGAIAVSVRSELDEALQEFSTLYRGCQQPDLSTDRPIQMEIRAQGRSRIGTRRYAIWGDGVRLFKDCRSDEVLPYLEWGINRRVAESRCEYLQLHAASMVRNGKAVILPGGSGAGKSTLAAALVARGWTYFCDEFALVDPLTMCLHPFPKALCVKAGSFSVVEQLPLPLSKRRYHVRTIQRHVGYVSHRNVRGPAVETSGPVRFVVFPRYTEGEKPRLSRMPRAQAVFALAGLTMNRPAYETRLTSTLGALVRNAECFRLQCGPAIDTCNLLECLLSSH